MFRTLPPRARKKSPLVRRFNDRRAPSDPAAYIDLLEGITASQADAASEYIRYKVREAGFARKIIPPTENIPNWDGQVWTSPPVVIYNENP